MFTYRYEDLMNIRRDVRRAAAGVAATVLCGAFTPARAQEPRRLVEADSVPADLAGALIAAGGFATAPRILVGSFPEWAANRLYLSSDARVLGSAFIGNSVVGVVTTSADPVAAIAGVKRAVLMPARRAPPRARTQQR